jgi:hypothetical protein
MSKLIYGAKSREEARLVERVINEFYRDMDGTIELAKTIPCMAWFVQILENATDVHDALMSSGSYYAHGLAMDTFYDIDDIPREMTELAAENGCPLSQCIMYKKTKSMFWAQMAADQGYSEGFYLLKKYREAAELGHVTSMWIYGMHECKEEQESYYWICKSYLLGKYFTSEPHSGSLAAKCQIGAMLPNHREFYIHHCEIVKKIINAWSLVAMRLGVVKDMRVYIAKIVWSGRVYRAEECKELYERKLSYTAK